MTTSRVCILTETYFPVIGGGETQARLLAEGLTAGGSTVLVLTRRTDPTLPRLEHHGPVDVYRLPPVGSGQLKKWGLLFSSISALIRLRSKYDLVFVSGFRIVGLSAVLVSKILGKVCVLKADSQGEMSGEFFRAGLARIRMRPSSLPFRAFLVMRNLILRRAHLFTAINSEVAAELQAAGVKSESVHLIPNCVDTDRFHPIKPRRKLAIRRELGIPDGSWVAIYTGRLVTYKGLPLLLEVWEEITRQNDRVLLLLVGGGGLDIHNCEAALRSYVAGNALEHAVRFTGEVQNVADLLQAADVFVFPTEDDAFPTSLIEAMACRLPVVTTPVGAIKDIIVDGRNGLLVQPRDSRALRAAVDRLMMDSNLTGFLGQAAWETVVARYSAAKVTGQYAELFYRLTQGRVKAASEADS